MSKKFSKTRKISRKQRSKKNRKSITNRKVGGDFSDYFKSSSTKLLAKLYVDAFNKFKIPNIELEEGDKQVIRNAIDNLSQLGTKISETPNKTLAEQLKINNQQPNRNLYNKPSKYDDLNTPISNLYKTYQYNLGTYNTLSELMQDSALIAKSKIDYLLYSKKKSMVNIGSNECKTLGLKPNTYYTNSAINNNKTPKYSDNYNLKTYEKQTQCGDCGEKTIS